MKNSDIQAIIYGSFVLYMIDVMLSKQDKVKGSTVKLKQAISKKLSNKEYIPYRKLSDEVWMKTIDELKDKGLQVVPFQFIENIILDNDEKFTSFYGSNIIDIAGNFVMKNTIDVKDRELMRKVIFDTTELTDTLKKNASKIIYEYNKKHK